MKYPLLVVLLCFFSFIHAQEFNLYVNYTDEVIEIDGIPNEKAWLTADSTFRFWQNFPYDTSSSVTLTSVKVLSGKNYFYVLAKCYDKHPDKKYVITSLKRDFAYELSDAFGVYIDPYNDQYNGFAFYSNPLGVQSEGLIQTGGAFGSSIDWDNKWFCESTLNDSGYILEMAIPFKSIRYNVGDSIWRINFSRNNLKINENSTWKPVPRNLNPSSLVNTGLLRFEIPPRKQKFNGAFIPYTIGSVSGEGNNLSQYNSKFNAGMDGKIVVTPSLNLDLTVNPDFAQVDVDRQVINLSRFSIFFPERRNFFLENSDLFSSFGFRIIRPFFSRRIGLSNGTNIPIPFGARLSGKIGRNWRVGLMNISTSGYRFNDSTYEEARNYTVAAFQRRIFSASNIAGIFVNSFDVRNPNKYNHVAGLDYNLQSKNGKWLGKAFWHQSFSPEKNPNSFANATWLFYTDKKIRLMWNHEYVNKNYNAANGFVPRIQYYDMEEAKSYLRSYYRLEPEAVYRIFPESKKINNLSMALYADLYYNEDFSMNDELVYPNMSLNFQNSSYINIARPINRTNLLFVTDILGNGQDTFYKGLYSYGGWELSYQSNLRKTFNYYISVFTGKFFNGERQNINTNLSLRIQPRLVLGLNGNIDHLVLPELNSMPERDRTLTLVAPYFELSFTKKLFLSTYIQYNSQADNINIYGRFQYRFKPMSDLFIVYGDNYTTAWGAVNRNLTVKFVYWINS